jgi:hypothetical protein
VIPAELQIDNVPAVEYVRGYWVFICSTASLLPGSQFTRELVMAMVGVGGLGLGPCIRFILIDAYKQGTNGSFYRLTAGPGD